MIKYVIALEPLLLYPVLYLWHVLWLLWLIIYHSDDSISYDCLRVAHTHAVLPSLSTTPSATTPYFTNNISLCLHSGMWEDDKASGPGTLEYHNGDVYEGDWESDQRNGTAQYSHPTTVICHFYRSILRTILRCLFLCHRRVTHYLRIRIRLQLLYH